MNETGERRGWFRRRKAERWVYAPRHRPKGAKLGQPWGKALSRIIATLMLFGVPIGTGALNLGAMTPKMASSINKIEHLGCCMDRQRVVGGARPRRDVPCHISNTI